MRPILLIARRELGTYLRTWTGYIVIAVMLAVDGLVFQAWGLGGGDKRSAEVLGIFFWASSGIVSIAGSLLLSMRLLAEERQLGTINLLYSSPVHDHEIVLGKYLSALAFLALMLLATLFMPAMIFINGKVSWGHIGAGYLGLFLLGSAVLAIGVLASSLTRSTVVAAIISAMIVTVLIVCWNIGRVVERPLSEVFTAMALWNLHFPPFQSGIVHSRDVVYYLVVTYVALFSATRVLEARRWR